ncbi:ADP-L-glycero-D-manno-heptose-6-epimerase [Azorhizobium oxalatiphilum]|uniref:ADP-L-glycero-D-manno-heptose-6-epimerase n=1 Tax=Azorhizobium oxalatiphilum TaxID=980631 RepID=A0A917FA85_9HYPH|nr:ADP-glyceromanno-heptose 6-epimerase [Azorhizobium oxalatiphilum]GGF59927.1 ADP-L-glycero-D-manno-heptose-6-epimerase [Azorhizobium oxalatiphilum]
MIKTAPGARDTVLVTGGAGFIGSNMARAFAEDGYRVVIADWLEDGPKWRNIADIALDDVIRPEAVSAFVEREGGRLHGIVHMGAISATTERDGDKIIARNVRPTLDLWTQCAAKGIRYIYASSGATYGDGAQGFRDDEAQNALASLAPLNAYGWSKLMADRRFVADVVAGRPCPPQWAGLRFFNVYGPGEDHKGDMRSVIHKIYPTAAKGEAVTLFKSHHPDYEDGGQLRDFLYVKDCVSVAQWLLETPGVSGIFNIGTGAARSFADLARAVFTAAGQAPRIDYVDMPESLRGAYQYFTQADVSKLKAAGYTKPFTSLEDGVSDYVTRYLRGGNAA